MDENQTRYRYSFCLLPAAFAAQLVLEFVLTNKFYMKFLTPYVIIELRPFRDEVYMKYYLISFLAIFTSLFVIANYFTGAANGAGKPVKKAVMIPVPATTISVDAGTLCPKYCKKTTIGMFGLGLGLAAGEKKDYCKCPEIRVLPIELEAANQKKSNFIPHDAFCPNAYQKMSANSCPSPLCETLPRSHPCGYDRCYCKAYLLGPDEPKSSRRPGRKGTSSPPDEDNSNSAGT